MTKERCHILVADDDSEDRELIVEAFEEVGVLNAVVCTENGEAAIRYLDACELDALPCLVILDLNMPRMNGRQTLQYLKSNSRYKDITVVIYSTSINQIEKEACLLLGAHSYITKPVLYRESIETAQHLKDLCAVYS